MILKPVTQGELRDVWPWVRAGLEAIIKRCAETWIPEDVFVSIRSGESYLYAIDDIGFVVLRKHNDFGVPVLFVWCLWAEGLWMKSDEFMADLDDLARSIGAKLIRYTSTLESWARCGYFEPKGRIYERQVEG